MRDLTDACSLLDSLRTDNEEINKMIERLEELKAIATSVTVATDKEAVQSSGSQDKMASIVAKIIDLEYDIDAEIEGYVARRDFVKDIIFKIKNENYQNMMYDYFICNIPLWQIEENENITHNSAKNRLMRSKRVFEKIFEENKKHKIQDIVFRE